MNTWVIYGLTVAFVDNGWCKSKACLHVKHVKAIGVVGILEGTGKEKVGAKFETRFSWKLKS